MNARDELAAQVAEHGPFPMPVGPNPGEVLADVVAAAVRTHERGGWDDVQIDALRAALFEYRDRAEAPATATELDRLRAEGAQLYSDLTGANLARWEEELDTARLRLALASAQRGRATARAEFFGEQAQHRTTVEQRNEHARELVRLRARVAELETAPASPWERAVAGLNALADADIAFWVEPDGHISGPFGDEHIEWDQKTSRWRLVHDDEDAT